MVINHKNGNNLFNNGIQKSSKRYGVTNE